MFSSWTLLEPATQQSLQELSLRPAFGCCYDNSITLWNRTHTPSILTTKQQPNSPSILMPFLVTSTDPCALKLLYKRNTNNLFSEPSFGGKLNFWHRDELKAFLKRNGFGETSWERNHLLTGGLKLCFQGELNTGLQMERRALDTGQAPKYWVSCCTTGPLPEPTKG